MVIEWARYRKRLGVLGLMFLVALFTLPRWPIITAPSAVRQTVRSYLSHQVWNFRTYVQDTLLHPGSIIQNTLGYALSVGTVGDRGQGVGGTWVYYENASGLGVLVPKLFGTDVIAVGNFVFSAGPLRRRRSLYWHEYRHYQQSTELGLLFLPTYVINTVVHGYAHNPLERDAREWGWRQRRLPAAWASEQPSAAEA